jgi:hypothetical protein
MPNNQVTEAAMAQANCAVLSVCRRLWVLWIPARRFICGRDHGVYAATALALTTGNATIRA